MNICVICPEIGNAGGKAFIGGHVNNVIRLSRMLAESGHQVTIITTPHRYGGSEESIEYADVHTLPIYDPYLSVPYCIKFLFLAAIKARELSTKKKFDIIHGHSGYLTPALITNIASTLSHVPSVHSIYCPVEEEKRNNIAALLSRGTLAAIYIKNVKKLLSVTPNITKSLIAVGIDQDRIRYIPLLIDTKKFNPQVSGEKIKATYNISNKPTLVYVGNLSKTKGIHILIDALKIIKQKYSDVRLLMVINMPIERFHDPERYEIDMELIIDVKTKIKEYGLDDNVIPIGITNNLEEIIAAGDLFLIPFLEITGVADYPLSLLEAMAIGKTIIATKVGGIPEILITGTNGVLIEPNDAIALAESSINLLESKEKAKRLGENASTTISENFRGDIVLKQLEEIYKEVTVNDSNY